MGASIDLQTDLYQPNYNFTARSIVAISRLVAVLADSTDPINLSKLAGLTEVSKPHLLQMLDALTQTGLLIKIPAQGKQMSANRLPAKYSFISPSLRLANQIIIGHPATFATNRGVLLEDIAYMYYHRHFGQSGTGSLAHPYNKVGAYVTSS